MPDFSLGPRHETDEHYALLRHTLTLNPSGVALEFGVGKGESTRIIAEHMPVIGFDSWLGLPETWRPGYPAGSFAHMPPEIPNAELVDGWYDDSLPEFDFGLIGPVGLVHIDCDLYSSTRTVFNHIGRWLRPGTHIVFDEWHGYEDCERYEQRAFREYAERTGIDWTVIGHGIQQWSILCV